MKTIIDPVSEQSFKLGRKRPISNGPRFNLSNYLKLSLPTPPATVSYTTKATIALSKMYMNDALGDCVIAGMEHVCGVLTGNAGTQMTFTNTQTIRLYSIIGGYDPSMVQSDGSNPTDNGCDEVTALNYWQNKGIPAQFIPQAVPPTPVHKINGWMAVNGANVTEVKTALWLFENLYFGLELPDAWITPFPSGSGFTWDVAGDPDPENGHCIMGAGYNASGVTIDTWGMLGTITYAAIAKYVTQPSGQLYCVISQDAINKATLKAPNGFNYSQLLADFNSMKA